jgi:hypothetical protein
MIVTGTWKASVILSLFPLRTVAGIRLPRANDTLWEKNLMNTNRTHKHPTGVYLTCSSRGDLVYIPGIGEVGGVCAKAYSRRVLRHYARRQRQEIQQGLVENHLAALEAACGEVEPPELQAKTQAVLSPDEFVRLVRDRNR